MGKFSKFGHTKLIRINGKMRSEHYCNLLQDNFLPNLQNLSPAGGYFQQDNAPIHISRYFRRYFSKSNLQVLEWPPLSPDLNPIENVWGIMKQKLSQKQYSNFNELFANLELIWEELMNDSELISNLISSINDRISLLIANGGGPTEY